ncbi:MAG: hypothetical protein JOZ58_26680 [Acetobacteraceae bacterium]|nr:hypothetical protein [Acetobacteraceae bacterium]
MAVTALPDEAALRLDAGADRVVAFRLGIEMRFWDLETNKDRRGVMFKAPSCMRLLSQSKASSTGGGNCGACVGVLATDAVQEFDDENGGS